MFYDFVLHEVVTNIVENEIGQEIEELTKAEPFKGDVQPVDEHIKATTWGNDIVGTLTLYTDKNLSEGDYVYYDGVYQVEKKIKWDYNIYLLKRVDVILNG